MILYQSAKGRAEEISPPGLALGLERGDMFSRTIQEQEIVLGQEDACLFYTDGLNEAQDRRHDEFGEKRLLELIERYRSLPGREVLNRITTEIDRFTGGVRQHDDMTAVFIRMI
jgi:sigma-B regulation protein RsbU (phosphoserine phosphatase)